MPLLSVRDEAARDEDESTVQTISELSNQISILCKKVSARDAIIKKIAKLMLVMFELFKLDDNGENKINWTDHRIRVYMKANFDVFCDILNIKRFADHAGAQRIARQIGKLHQETK